MLSNAFPWFAQLETPLGGFIGKFAGHYAQGMGSVEVTLVDIDPVASTWRGDAADLVELGLRHVDGSK